MLPRNAARAVVMVVIATVFAALLPGTTAWAAQRTVSGGRFDWGIKSSFQSYVTGPVANGSWSLTRGAATTGRSDFRFHSARGSYDPGSGAFRAAFSGGVHFTGHRRTDNSYELDLAISRPSVSISQGKGTLFVDVTSRERGSGEVTTGQQVPFASLDLSRIDMRGGGSPVVLDQVPATLTSQGARAFAGYYTAGTPLDPVSLSADLTATGSSAKPSTPPEPSPDKGRKKPGRIVDAAVDWGVRRTFREYVTGPVARGEWKLSEGAQDGGALFRFPSGKGTFHTGTLTKTGKPSTQARLDARFSGSIRFTGAHGLDLTLAAPAVTVKGGTGTLHADVRDAGGTDPHRPLVTFPATGLSVKNGLAVLTEVPTKLTAEGAEAFGSMYREGTAMDPLSLAVTLDKSAALPALPDLGSDAGPGSSASPAGKKAGRTIEAGDGSAGGFPYLPVLSAAALVLAALAATALFLAWRRAAGEADPASPEPPTT